MSRLLVAALLIKVGLCSSSAWAQAPKALPKVQVSRSINPVFPYEALIAGKSGSAEVNFTVGTDGRAILLSTERATDRAFAMALQADIEAIEFIPPRRNGQPQMTMTRESFDFSAKPALDPIAEGILNELRKPNPAITPVEALDAKPEAIRQPPSAYPWVLRADAMSGEAVIEFIVDRNGRTLFPRIVSASHEDFGWAAATAVLRWRYKPPTKGGAKVDTRITETVVFDIKKASEMW
ncbi:MAG: energy transducer TonB [Nibricoccus sp.]